MNCTNHEQIPAVAVCSRCSQPLCRDCAIHWQDSVVCKRCLEGKEGQKEQSAQEHAPPMRKSPVLAGFLSLLPGAGQVYVGYYLAGFIYLLIVAMTISGLERGPELGPFLGIFLTFFWTFNIIDAVRKAQNYNRYALGEEIEKGPTDSPLVGGIILIVIGLILTLEITFGIQLDFMEIIWPLGVLGGGIYLIIRYFHTRERLREERMMHSTRHAAVPPTAGTGSAAEDDRRDSTYEQS
ncbi:MAG: hypothetical protein KAY32_17530 [Candidatus Eisenbacteria sp.]|nr:hypothetical protein [Candidatus Eisenbacteria bacterium]